MDTQEIPGFLIPACKIKSHVRVAGAELIIETAGPEGIEELKFDLVQIIHAFEVEIGNDRVIHDHHENAQEKAEDHDRPENSHQVDAAGADCEDLVVGGQAAEGDKNPHKHGTGNCEGQQGGKEAESKAPDEDRVDPFAHKDVRKAEYPRYEKQEREEQQPEDGGADKFPQDIFFQDHHNSDTIKMPGLFFPEST